ncbi:MAG TPA: YbaB/EbfC family nucleoid-associated protein [Saprospiraceae bacterium]|nr:YbaB/EbfC family nucleoid-associated protein [Saprospiraceae bacterium]
MLANFEEQQKKMQESFRAIEIINEHSSGAIRVISNAIPELRSISIDRSKIDINNEEELEDLLIVTINEIILMAQAKQAELSQKMLSEMLPPGMGNLKDLFS